MIVKVFSNLNDSVIICFRTAADPCGLLTRSAVESARGFKVCFASDKDSEIATGGIQVIV